MPPLQVFPYLKGEPYAPAPTPILSPGTEYFTNQLTGEIFIDYEAYISTLRLYASAVWTASLGGTNFTSFQQAQQNLKSRLCLPYSVFQFITSLTHNFKGKLDELLTTITTVLDHLLLPGEEVWCYIPHSTRPLIGTFAKSLPPSKSLVTICNAPAFLVSSAEASGTVHEDGSIDLLLNKESVKRRKDLTKTILRTILKQISTKSCGYFKVLPSVLKNLHVPDSPPANNGREGEVISIDDDVPVVKQKKSLNQSKITDFAHQTQSKPIIRRSFPIDDDEISDHTQSFDGQPPPKVASFPVKETPDDVFDLDSDHVTSLLELSEFISSFSKLLSLSPISFSSLVDSFLDDSVKSPEDLGSLNCTIIDEVFISLIIQSFGKRFSPSPGNWVEVLAKNLRKLYKEFDEEEAQELNTVLVQAIQEASEVVEEEVVEEEVVEEEQMEEEVVEEEKEDSEVEEESPEEEVTEHVDSGDVDSSVEEEQSVGSDEDSNEEKEDEEQEEDVSYGEEAMENPPQDMMTSSEELSDSDESSSEDERPVLRRSSRLSKKPAVFTPSRKEECKRNSQTSPTEPEVKRPNLSDEESAHSESEAEHSLSSEELPEEEEVLVFGNVSYNASDAVRNFNSFIALKVDQRIELVEYLVDLCLQSESVQNYVDNTFVDVMDIKKSKTEMEQAEKKRHRDAMIKLSSKEASQKIKEVKEAILALKNEISNLEGVEQKRAQGKLDRLERRKDSLLAAKSDEIERHRKKMAATSSKFTELEHRAVIRTEPLGVDRNGLVYWFFFSSPNCVWLENKGEEESTWQVVTSEEVFCELLSWLDVRGRKEHSLKSKLTEIQEMFCSSCEIEDHLLLPYGKELTFGRRKVQQWKNVLRK
ncbi:hypothetical protein GEMRC1_001655 [Eukaryota sp. GEM-RC1]